MKELTLTQADLARMTGMPRSTLSELFAGIHHQTTYLPELHEALQWPPPSSAAPAEEVDPLAGENSRARLLRQNMRKLREAAGFDVEGLADEVDLSADTILAYEHGDRPLLHTDLDDIAKALGHDIEHFSLEGKLPPSRLGPYEKLWRRRRLLAKLTPEQRSRAGDVQAKYDAELAEALSPEFVAHKKTQAAAFNKAKKKGKR